MYHEVDAKMKKFEKTSKLVAIYNTIIQLDTKWVLTNEFCGAIICESDAEMTNASGRGESKRVNLKSQVTRT